MSPQSIGAMMAVAALALVLDGLPLGAQRPPPPPPPPQCEVPADRPWAFLDATSEIQFIPDTTSTNIFRAIQFAYFNQDGWLDVVSAQAESAAGVVGKGYRGALYMNENGRFVDKTAQYIPWLLAAEVRWWVVPHDFVGPGAGPTDGWIDLYFGGGSSRKGSRFFRNLGLNGSNQWLGFADESSRITGPSAAGRNSYHQHKADLDGDGWMDVVEYPNAGAGAGQIRALMNRSGTFVDETNDRLPLRSEPSLFGHVEDLSGDGAPDISVANVNPPGGLPEVRVLINDGTGHFPSSLEQTVPQPTGSDVYGVEHVDVNGDGKLDIYVINFGKAGNDQDGILLNTGTGNQLFNTVYFPEIPILSKDHDGDHAVGADFDGDSRIDIAVAQFAKRTFVLRNLTCNGVTRLVEQTPPEVPTGNAFRVRSFDANRDGAPDLWIGLSKANVGHALLIGNVPEQESNDTIAAANATTTFPALRTGKIAADADADVFTVPPDAVANGAKFVLTPAADSDLELLLLDQSGSVVAFSSGSGGGGVEQIDLPAGGTGARFLSVGRQGTLGSGTYRLGLARPTSGATSLSDVSVEGVNQRQ